MMVAVTIDGRIIHVERQTPILEIARKLGIDIPTLCYHEALKPFGSCRLCVVEIVKGKRSRLVTSCNYPAEDGLTVLTASEKVKKTRKMIVELLLARCPNVPLVQQMAEEMGVKASSCKKKDDQQCILCGLCVRVCEEIVGVSAINFANRGVEREVNTPFGANSDVCIGCGSCTYICPTGCIEMVEDPGAAGGRGMKMGNLVMKACPNNYKCEACQVDQEFLEEIKGLIKGARAWK